MSYIGSKPESYEGKRLVAAQEGVEWGMERHEIIGEEAQKLIQSANAREAIHRIFEASGEVSLGKAARWADELKASGPQDPATKRFRADSRNKKHETWHYVNLPLEMPAYDRQKYPQFTRSDDVVQMLFLSVESLLAPNPRARFEEIIALRWIAHLMGDIHQPVHVGCGYIANPATQNARLVFKVQEAIGLPSDRGGNDLRLPNETNLHSYWDTQLRPNAIINPVSIAGFPKSEIQARIVGWAGETLKAARSAYQSLKITGYKANKRYSVDWEGEAAYRQRCAPIVSERMASASANLAALLDSIWP